MAPIRSGCIILDLDGPLLDGRLRHYACHRAILVDRGLRPLPLERYWHMKRNRAPLSDQLAEAGAESIEEAYRRAWLERIEHPDLLRLDRVQPGALARLDAWRARGRTLILATQRRDPDALHRQLERVGLSDRLDRVIVCPAGPGGEHHKARAVRAAEPKLHPESSVWIGDTEVDILAARELGCRVWAVTCGLRSRAFLEKFSPDHMVDDLRAVELEL